jgi:hypothetical protein
VKVRISFTVDIDPADWTLNYGIENGAEIRKDVQALAEETVRAQFEASGIPIR